MQQASVASHDQTCHWKKHLLFVVSFGAILGDLPSSDEGVSDMAALLGYQATEGSLERDEKINRQHQTVFGLRYLNVS